MNCKEESSVGATFATPQAPYFRYLSAHSQGWTEASRAQKALELLINTADDSNAIEYDLRRRPDEIVAQVLDLKNPDSSSAGQDLVDSNKLLHLQELAQWRKDPEPLDDFVNSLKTCDSTVHTRLLFWQSPGSTAQELALETLMLCHVLGVELDLRPADVDTIAQLNKPYINLDDGRRPSLNTGFFSMFGPLPLIEKVACTGACIGKRRLGQSSPDVVVIRVYSFFPPPCVMKNWQFNCTHGLWRPPSASTWCSAPTTVEGGQDERNARNMFVDGLRQRLVDVSTLTESAAHSSSPAEAPWDPEQYAESGKSPRFGSTVNTSVTPAFREPATGYTLGGHWLFVVLSLYAIMYNNQLELLRQKWTGLHNFSSVSAQQRLVWLEMRHLCAVVEVVIDQIEALQRDVPRLSRMDYEGALDRYKRILKDAQRKAENMRNTFDTVIQLKSIDVSESLITESRSAVAVTVLAFIFIPLNLASSVFGMNVQEINHTGHSIASFLITACVMLIASGFAWAVWQASRNWEMVYDSSKYANRTQWYGMKPRERFKAVLHQWRITEFVVWQKYAAYVGLRPVQRPSVLPQ